MKEVNLEVADKKLRDIVENLKKDGFPGMISTEEALVSLTETQMEAVTELFEAVEKEKRTEGSPQATSPGDGFWVARNLIREKLQNAIKAGLIHLAIVQKNTVNYGAIPDPEENWKYYLLPDLNYACWRCGSGILGKEQKVSIHDGPFPFSGSGKVKSKIVPYCPNCEKEPPDHDIVKENPSEDIVNDLRYFSGQGSRG